MRDKVTNTTKLQNFHPNNNNMPGPSLSAGTITGATPTTAPDFLVRPTIAGQQFSIASPYSTPSLTASSPSGTGAVTLINPQSVSWSNLTNLEFTATTTPTAVGSASFLVALPGRTTNFANTFDIKVWVQGRDASLNVINNCVGFATVSGTTAQINFNVNGSSSFVSHVLDIRIQYIMA